MLKLQILTQEETVSEEEVDSVTIPTAAGEITVLPGHTTLFSKLDLGQLIMRKGGKEEMLAVHGGFVDIGPSWVKVMADTAIRAADINELKAKEAIAAAEKAMQEKDKGQDFLEAQMSLQRALLELNTIKKWKKRAMQG